MPQMHVYRVTQTRTLEIRASDPGDAADGARYLFRGEEIPQEIRDRYVAPIPSSGKPRIINLDVTEVR